MTGASWEHNRIAMYILISQDKPRIEGYTKQKGQWVLSDAIGLDAVFEIPSIDCTLALKDVYHV